MAILLGLIAFLYEVLQSSGNPSEQISWYSVLIIVVSAAATRLCRAQEQFDLFEPLYMVFALFLLFYPVRALFAVWLDDSWFDPSKPPIWKALSASAMGFVSFAIGYKCVARKPAVRRKLWLDRTWNVSRADTVSAAFLAVGVAGFLAVRVLGGSFFYFILLDPETKGPQDMKAWFFYLLWVCVFVQVAALIQFGSWLSTGHRTVWTIVVCSGALLSTFMLARYFTVLFLIMLAMSWHYKKRKITLIQVVILFVLVIGYLGFAGLYREIISPSVSSGDTGELVELAGQQNKLVIRYVVNNLEELSNLSEVISMTPAELPYQFGVTFTPVILKPVPRVLMPAKPLGASALFTREIDPSAYDNGFVTALGAFGEWYLNFWWPGIVLGMALTGALAASGYKFMRVTGEFGRIVLYSSSILILFSWVRSDFNAATTYGLYYFIPMILAFTYIITDA